MHVAGETVSASSRQSETVELYSLQNATVVMLFQCIRSMVVVCLLCQRMADGSDEATLLP